jgi:hypothetical protein
LDLVSDQAVKARAILVPLGGRFRDDHPEPVRLDRRNLRQPPAGDGHAGVGLVRKRERQLGARVDHEHPKPFRVG